MKQVIILMTLLTMAGCDKAGNPVSPVTDTLHSDNLQVTFSIPREAYSGRDTVKATTTVYNPGDTTVRVDVPVCWPTAWYTVRNGSGLTKLSYAAPRDYGCSSIVGYEVLPHQSQEIPLLNVTVPVVDIDSTGNAQDPYVFTVDNQFGIFSLKFLID